LRKDTCICTTFNGFEERGFPVDLFFELYGFDVLFDRDFTPWLLKVNTFPSLGFDEDVADEVN
jgi:hypothetical protein